MLFSIVVGVAPDVTGAFRGASARARLLAVQVFFPAALLQPAVQARPRQAAWGLAGLVSPTVMVQRGQKASSGLHPTSAPLAYASGHLVYRPACHQNPAGNAARGMGKSEGAAPRSGVSRCPCSGMGSRPHKTRNDDRDRFRRAVADPITLIFSEARHARRSE